VILSERCDPAIREALEPLLRFRRRQAGNRYREFIHRLGETKQEFLARFGAGLGPADPEKVPYYLLLVGSPCDIPFVFQYQLDVQYAVGRLALDGPDDYARYAENVVRAETREATGLRQAALFAPAHSGDENTNLSCHHFATPMAESLEREPSRWEVSRVVGADATKERLLGLLGGIDTPSVLFTATHGLVLPYGHARQRAQQGALLCQGWEGPGRLRPQDYLNANDISADADLDGLIVFSFGCYTGGTPDQDEQLRNSNGERLATAPEPFVARLPQKLLAHPRGGALAVIGHVDRAWSWSFVWKQAGPQIAAYVSTLKRLLLGKPIGWALEYLNQRYAELATELTVMLDELRERNVADPADLADLWTAHHDARSFVLLGDPAVRAVPRSRCGDRRS
jgi:hypothetical protein